MSDGTANHKPALTAFLVLSILVFVAAALYTAVVVRLLPTWTDRGQFGNSFGLLASIFSGLAFVAVAVALVIQAIEFASAERERHETLEAISAQVAVAANQLALTAIEYQLAIEAKDLRESSDGEEQTAIQDRIHQLQEEQRMKAKEARTYEALISGDPT